MFLGIRDKEFETIGRHILPAIKNVKGKYCRPRAIGEMTWFLNIFNIGELIVKIKWGNYEYWRCK